MAHRWQGSGSDLKLWRKLQDQNPLGGRSSGIDYKYLKVLQPLDFDSVSGSTYKGEKEAYEFNYSYAHNRNHPIWWVEFPVASAMAAIVPIYGMNSNGPNRRLHSTETISRHTHLPTS
ncbi:hypothetical protein IEQ34_022405 [Dendrobium chrysotoxum]|uniref:Uncharacterized protein n=1 Tax=Dendrobium chrysotoxum TaxID=161865 RepID=A0AAV7FK38_DENCH|nr:hypothetical protein IEQ34_022405 [Dendrobium chrysotoxum]